MEWWTIILLIIIIWYFYRGREGLSSRPSDKLRDTMVGDIMRNRHMLRGSLDDMRDKIAWIDAVTFEDLRMLSSRNAFTHQNVASLLQ